MRKRVAMLVYVDLDPVPGGAFSDEDSALQLMGHILDQRIGHYNPIVSFAPEGFQPLNSPRKGVETSQEIPRASKITDHTIDITGGIPIAGSAPENTGVLTTEDLAMSYNINEGRVDA